LSNGHRKIHRTDIIGKATVLHEPPSLRSFITDPHPKFYCQERLLEDRRIVPLLKPLSDCDMCTASLAKKEKSYIHFLRQIKLPAADFYSGGGGGMIGAKGFFDHKHVVEMDEKACRTLRFVTAVCP